MSEAITVLLMLEAIDKASGIIEGITGKLEGLGAKAQDAAAKAAMTGEELESAQVKAEAAANAYRVAVEEQDAAQARLLESTRAVRGAQDAAARAAQAQAAAQGEVGAAFGASADEMLAKYTQLADAAAAEAGAVEASAAKITELEGKLAAAHGAAADAVQGALDREKASYAQLAASAQESAAAVAAAFSASDAKVLAGYQEQAAGAEAAAAAAKAASTEQIAALDGLSAAQKDVAARNAEMTAAQDAANTKVDTGAAVMKGATVAAVATAAAVAGIGYESVKSAANFQQATTVLQTSGGETAAQMATVRAGILSISAGTGTGIQELTNGMYMIGSAGYTGAKGLTVLTAAAQGAKAENADLGTVSNALTTVLKDYGMGADKATAAMDQMIAVVQNGKTTTEALAGSLSNVLPSAASAKLGFDQVGGALATMTGEGMSAQQAAQDLNHSIGALQNPNAVAVKEMQALGVNSTNLSKNLGKAGLTGTFEILSNAITTHMGKDGLVIQNAFASSKQAAADASAEIAKMPASLQKLAQSYLAGSISAKQWKADLQGLDPISAKLMAQFAGTADKTHEFNSLLTSGAPAAQTYNAAMSKMMGGTTGLQTALMLTGGNMATFQKNVAAVGQAGKSAGRDVNGWAEIQGNLNQKLSELKQTAEAASIQLGTALLPMVTKILGVVMKIVTPIATWIEHNKTLAAAILLVVGGLATFITVMVAVAKVVKTVQEAWAVLGTAMGFIEPAATAAGEATAAAGEEMAAAGEAADIAWGPWLLAIAAIGVAAYEIVEHWSTVKRWLGDFWGWIKSIFGDAVSFVKSHVNEVAIALTVILGPIGLVAGAALEIVTHWKDVSAFFSQLWGDIERIFDTAVRTAVGIIEHWYPLILGVLSGGVLLVPALIYKYWDQIGSFVSRAWDAAVRIVEHWYPLILGILSGGIFLIPALIYKYWSQITSYISQAWDDALTYIRSIPGKIADVFSGAGSWLLDAGKQIIQGLINGVENMAGAAFDAVKNVGSGIVNVAKKILNIFSPSKEFQSIGEMTMAGMVQGIAGAAPSVNAAMRNAMKGLTGPSITASVVANAQATGAQLGVAVASGLGGAASSGGGIGGATVVQNFTGNYIISDSEITKFANMVGGKVATQLGPQGGVNLVLR